MRTVFPVKYYKDEGFVERKIELDDNDLQEIIQDWLIDNADFEFDEVYLDLDEPEHEQWGDAEVGVSLDKHRQRKNDSKRRLSGAPKTPSFRAGSSQQ